MKWIILIIGIGLFRGIVFPDYMFYPNMIIIPLGMPLLSAVLSAYFGETKRLEWMSSILWCLFSVYLSTFIGIIVYGISCGWQYVFDDKESQAIFIGTIGLQTIVFFICLGFFYLIGKRYNKANSADAKSSAAD